MDSTRLEKCRRQIWSKLPFIGGWLQGQALKALADDGSAEAVRILEEAVASSEDEALGAAAVESLHQSALDDNVAAQEALCRLVIYHDHPGARAIVAAREYTPHEETNRVL